MVEQTQLRITFGQKYHREPHTLLPDWACHPDGWLEIVAATEVEAVTLLIEHVGSLDSGVIECAGIYRRDEWDRFGNWFPKGCLGVIDSDGLRRVEGNGDG